MQVYNEERIIPFTGHESFVLQPGQHTLVRITDHHSLPDIMVLQAQYAQGQFIGLMTETWFQMRDNSRTPGSFRSWCLDLVPLAQAS